MQQDPGSPDTPTTGSTPPADPSPTGEMADGAGVAGTVNGAGARRMPPRPNGTGTEPSRVLHVRNLPHDCTEAELYAIGHPFGRVVNALILKGKNQGFIQMEDSITAGALVGYYTNAQASIRGQPVYFAYSTREEITHGNQSQPVTPSQVLLVSVVNLLYPITIEVLQQVFSKYGNILRIIIFTKNAGLQALIEFDSLQSAVNAKTALDGQNIYAGCCTLQIQFSTMATLNVKFNNEKSRDFTNPSLPAGNQQILTAMGLGNRFPPMGTNPTGYPNAMGMQVYGGYNPQPSNNSVGGGTVVLASGFDAEKMDPNKLFILFGVYGDVIRVKVLYNKKDHALIQMATPQQAQYAVTYLNGVTVHDQSIMVSHSKHSSVALPRPGTEQEAGGLTKDFTSSPLHRYKNPGSKNYHHICPPSQTLHLSNLPDPSDPVSEDSIRALFVDFGGVQQFKFFPNNPRMALIQLQSVDLAIQALVARHNHPIGETNLRVSFSKSGFRDEGDNGSSAGEENKPMESMEEGGATTAEAVATQATVTASE